MTAGASKAAQPGTSLCLGHLETSVPEEKEKRRHSFLWADLSEGN